MPNSEGGCPGRAAASICLLLPDDLSPQADRFGYEA
jgi:hypothetical protein